MKTPPRITHKTLSPALAVALLISAHCAEIELVSGSYQNLLDQKSAIEKNDTQALTDLQSLTKKADKDLRKGLLSVTQKAQLPPSGDKRDYLSMAPYWWPDPKKSNGLPFIRKDGRVNPKTRGEHVDYDRKNQFFSRLNTMCLAAYLSEDSKYADGAVELLEAWFVNPGTRMNPHLNYAQGIPGRNDGRPAGVIEWCGVGSVLTSIQLLRASEQLPEKTDKALVRWFEDYAEWLQNSKIGKEERDAHNNHGTWYDVQIVGILCFLERKTEAKAILEEVKSKRIATQIESDGRQPHELTRTKSLSYSKMNLNAFMKLVELGRKNDVDLWSYETKDGRSIRKAEAFLKPYLSGQKKWPYQQL